MKGFLVLKRVLCMVLLTSMLPFVMIGCGTEDIGVHSDTGTTGATDTPDMGTNAEESTDTQTDLEDKTLEPLKKEKEYNFLFIGNSYTQYNNMSSLMFKGITQSAGYNVNVEAIIKGA